MNITNMNVYNAITYAKTVNIYCPGNKTDKYYWGGERKLSITFTGGNDLRTKAEIPSITCTEIMTNIRKKIPSIIFTGIMTNVRK